MASQGEVEDKEFEGFEDEGEVSEEGGQPNKRKAEESTSEAKTPRKKSKRRKITDEDNFDEELGLNLSIGEMDSQLLVDYVAQRTKKFEPNLTMMEAADRYIPQGAVLDTTSWDRPRATRNLPHFLKRFAGDNLAYASEETGSPHTLVVAGAAMRAADLTRTLRVFQAEDAKVGKLFAKHIKMEEAMEFCKKNRYAPFLNLEIPGLHNVSISLGVGTPKRIADLLDDGALSSDHLKTVVIDASHIDQKRRGILDMRETLLPLVKLLTRSELRRRYAASDESEQVRLLFY
jgi:protein CMS1